MRKYFRQTKENPIWKERERADRKFTAMESDCLLTTRHTGTGCSAHSANSALSVPIEIGLPLTHPQSALTLYLFIKDGL